MTVKTTIKGCDLCKSQIDGFESLLEKVKAEAKKGQAKNLEWDCSPICSSCKTTLLEFGISINYHSSYR